MTPLIEFLNQINKTAARYAHEMEQIMFKDPSSSLVKVRKFAEAIINDVYKKENIALDYLSLYEKISYLTREGYIKKDIQKSFDMVRISGNKAAHLGEQNNIAEAYKLHKEMYNIAIWYYEVYIIERVKTPIYETPAPPQPENVEDMVKKQVMELLGMQEAKDLKDINIGQITQAQKESPKKTTIPIPNPIENTETSHTLNKNLQEGESYLLRELNRLKESSQEAVENANNFSLFKRYLHVDRKVQLDLEQVLEQNKEGRGNLILLCGNVGDGKSHLLAYLKQHKPHLLEGYKIFNDATESFSPKMDAMETLSQVLNAFSDQHIEQTNEKVVLAINMGVLHNFMAAEHREYSYKQLKDFVGNSNLFSSNIMTKYIRGKFSMLSFGDYHSFELRETGATSSFYTSILKKITDASDDNPFHKAFKEDQANEINTMVHENYKLLAKDTVQSQIVQIVIQTIVKKKLVISARAFLNFIADIIIPHNLSKLSLLTEFEVLENSIPNLLFNQEERSEILSALSEFDPIHKRSVYIDDIIMKLNTLEEWSLLIERYIPDHVPQKWLEPFKLKDSLMGYSLDLFLKTFIRLTFITNEKFANNIEETGYKDFLINLYYFNSGNKDGIKNFYEKIKTAIYMWKGSPKKDYIYINAANEKYRIAQKMNFKPSIEHIEVNDHEVLESFKSTISLKYFNSDKTEQISLEIDFPLYKLLTKVLKGYRPNKKDEEDAIQFVEFIGKLMNFGSKQEEMLIYFTKDQRTYSMFKDDFDAYVFEREY